MVNVGLIGCGAIGGRLAQELGRRFKGTARLIGIYDQEMKAAKRLAQRLRPRPPVLPLQTLMARSQLLMEAASPKAVGEILPHVIKHRQSLLVMSAGGLLRNKKLLRQAIAKSIPIYLPSGALVGIDGIKAGAVGKLRSVTLTTRKPPKALALPKIRKRRLVFQGSALKAVEAFPQNINVAATLALAGVGPRLTRVRIFADPAVRKNIHEVEAVGTFGRCTTRTENRPSRENPKTSQLAVFSAVATLRQIFEPLKIGT